MSHSFEADLSRVLDDLAVLVISITVAASCSDERTSEPQARMPRVDLEHMEARSPRAISCDI